MGPTKYIRFQEGKQRNGSIKAHEVLGLSNVMRFKILSQIGSWHTKLYKCNSLQLHLPHQTERQTDRQESRNPRCDEGFKVCSMSNRFSATLMDNPAGAAATVAPAAVRRRGRKVCVLPFIIQSSWHQKGWRQRF